MTRTAALGKPKRTARKPRAASDSYFDSSWLPWPSLIFVVPMMLLYEVGTRIFAVDPIHHTPVRILAFDLIRDFFSLFGVTGREIPPLAVIAILIGWHLARNDSWKFRPRILPEMAIESLLLGIPVILLSILCARHLPLAYPHVGNWREMLVLSIGAGIYEELIFRLIAFTLLSVLLLDLLKLRMFVAGPLIVLIPAILFSLYHYLGPEQFSVQSFVFRTLAGIYFGVIFLCRGFGITAGAHAAYDMLIVLLPGLTIGH